MYDKYPTNTLSRFKRIANRYWLTDDEAKGYLSTHIVQDQHEPTPKFIHIYSKIPHSYKMDTFIGQPNYLMLFNANTRKAYAYEMNTKSSTDMLRSLNTFIKVEPDCRAIISDMGTAYLSKSVLDFIIDIMGIHYNNDQNKLGVINKFMRTVRYIK